MANRVQNTTKILADHLSKAKKERQGVAPLTQLQPDLSIQQAYEVQLLTIQREMQAGKYVVGKKIGLTSVAMQKLLGVDQPDYS